MKFRPSILALPFALAALFTAGAARADVVPNPEENCPDGSKGATCHGGPYCSPDTCASDADCDEGQACQDVQLCTATIDCGGGGGPSPTTEVTAACDGTCAEGTCNTLKVCVTPGGAGGNGNGGDDLVVTGCACSTLGHGAAFGSVGALLFAAGLAGLGARRKRR